MRAAIVVATLVALATPATADDRRIVGILEGFRWALVSGTTLNVGYAVYSAVASCVVLALGALFFRRMERKFSDVV